MMHVVGVQDGAFQGASIAKPFLLLISVFNSGLLVV